MTIGIMQPYLFPYIGYFQLIAEVDKYVIYDDVQYIKRGWINRNNLLINNSDHMFTISLEGASTTKLINQVCIKDDFITFEKTIRQNYSKAPFFSGVMELLSEILACEDKNLARFAGNSLELISSYIGIKAEFIYSSELKTGRDQKRQDRILAICRELEATRYINAIGGRSLYDKAEFMTQGVQLNFLQTDKITYKQFGAPFVPNLSIIDVMMFNPPSTIKTMLREYHLL